MLVRLEQRKMENSESAARQSGLAQRTSGQGGTAARGGPRQPK